MKSRIFTTAVGQIIVSSMVVVVHGCVGGSPEMFVAAAQDEFANEEVDGVDPVPLPDPDPVLEPNPSAEQLL